MKLEYAISLDDFRALQVPFSQRVGATVWFKRAVVASSAMAALGMYCIAEGYGRSVGGFFVALGTIGVALGYLRDVRSVRRAKQEYERNISVAYDRSHCRDHRRLDVDDTGFTLTCNCGSRTHKWSELLQFAENARFFQLRTKADGVILPKSAFASEGDQTELRRRATEQIARTAGFAQRPVELVFHKLDYWRATLLHIIRGGGWRPLARVGLPLLAAACILAVFHEKPPHNVMEKGVAIEMAAFGLIMGFVLLRVVRGRRLSGNNSTAVRMSFGEEGLHLQDSITISRNPWESFCGYLESRSIFLLYYSAKLYRIVPKRALGSRETQFRELMQRKVSPFDFRYPFRLGSREVSKSV